MVFLSSKVHDHCVIVRALKNVNFIIICPNFKVNYLDEILHVLRNFKFTMIYPNLKVNVVIYLNLSVNVEIYYFFMLLGQELNFFVFKSINVVR